MQPLLPKPPTVYVTLSTAPLIFVFCFFFKQFADKKIIQKMKFWLTLRSSQFRFELLNRFVLFLSRYGVAFTYYGISLNIAGFGLNPYLTQFIFASIEMPMKIGVYFCLEKLGRRQCEMGALLSTGLCLFINIFIPTGTSLFGSLNNY